MTYTQQMKKTKKKVLKVEIVTPEIEIASATYKKPPTPEGKPIPLPAEPTLKPVINPNEPKIVPIEEGFKKPSITNVRPAHTRKQYLALIADYKKQNPAKYEQKKAELEAKLAKLK